jgi:exopolysaccharide biosynthesis WecB/TagA/CpsF family protein
MMIWSDGGSGSVTVTVPDQASLLADLSRRFAAGQGFSVATLNLDHVVKLSRNPLFRDAYRAQTHVTADGNPIVWLSRLAGQRVKLVPGSELIDPLAALAARAGVSVALFGATEAALAAASAALVARHPGLEVVLCRAPAMGFDPQGAAAAEDIDAIESSGARLCFLALGAPKQEVFAARAHAALPGVGFVSIGAGLDFIAGTQRRAPAWVRAVAAEWLWRLLSDPRRLAARYGACLAILPMLTGRALRLRYQNGQVS